MPLNSVCKIERDRVFDFVVGRGSNNLQLEPAGDSVEANFATLLLCGVERNPAYDDLHCKERANMSGTLTKLENSSGELELYYCLSDPGNSYPVSDQLSHILPDDEIHVDEFVDIWVKKPNLKNLIKVGTVGPIAGIVFEVNSIEFENESTILEFMKKIQDGKKS